MIARTSRLLLIAFAASLSMVAAAPLSNGMEQLRDAVGEVSYDVKVLQRSVNEFHEIAANAGLSDDISRALGEAVDELMNNIGRIISITGSITDDDRGDGDSGRGGIWDNI
ncbi:hypothetical protein BGX27_003230 [Mortierella sp. AM989]|nr:hypothetical protein BGX27_003230 [Mortierella sp. AM989]